MKIVYISQAEIPSSSAYSIHIMKMCQAFAMLNHEVYLIIPEGKPRQQIGIRDIYDYYGVNRCFQIERIYWPKLKKPGRLWALEAVISATKYNPNIIYTRYLPAAFFATCNNLPIIYEEHQLKKSYHNPLADYTSKLTNWWSLYLKPLLYTMHAKFITSISKHKKEERKYIALYHKLFKMRGFQNELKLLKWLTHYPMLLRFIVITHALKKDITKLFPELANKILVAPDGADIPRNENLHRINIDKTKGKLQVGYCGNLYPGKGMEVIEALLPLCPWACFHIVGGTQPDLKFWRDRLKRYRNIIFYGHVPPDHTAAYISHFDVCLLPNQPKVRTFSNKKDVDIGSHTSPLKMFEYMALGKPIVASDLPVLKEVLKHEYNALLSSHDDPVSWANALQRLLDDQSLRKRLGQQALNDFIKNYTWKSRAKKILQGVNIESGLNKIN